MAKKPMLLIKDHPEMQEIERVNDERVAFFKKRLEAAREEISKLHDQMHDLHWNSVYEYLDKIGVPHKGKKGRYSMSNGVLYDLDDSDHGSSSGGVEIRGMNDLLKFLKHLTE